MPLPGRSVLLHPHRDWRVAPTSRSRRLASMQPERCSRRCVRSEAHRFISRLFGSFVRFALFHATHVDGACAPSSLPCHMRSPPPDDSRASPPRRPLVQACRAFRVTRRTDSSRHAAAEGAPLMELESMSTRGIRRSARVSRETSRRQCPMRVSRVRAAPRASWPPGMTWHWGGRGKT